VRHWFTARFILVVLMVVAAPGAALAHLFLTWLPGRVELAQVSHAVWRDAAQLDAEWLQNARFRRESEYLRQAAAAVRGRPGAGWLAQRDPHRVFDHLAEVFSDPRISLEQLTLDEPGLYAAASRRNLLACEQVTVLCTGDYAGLTACLDRLISLDLPMRCEHLSWGLGDERLSLALDLKIPFAPADALRETLADAEGLEEDDDS
jgi:hypothetical protein